jgi:hypothetical protein
MVFRIASWMLTFSVALGLGAPAVSFDPPQGHEP